MTSRAHVEFDALARGVALSITRGEDRSARQYLAWEPVRVVNAPEDDYGIRPPADAVLHLEEDDARALYEALADYFGHAGHDTRSLRKDYDAERARVDRLIGHIVGSGAA